MVKSIRLLAPNFGCVLGFDSESAVSSDLEMLPVEQRHNVAGLQHRPSYQGRLGDIPLMPCSYVLLARLSKQNPAAGAQKQDFT